MNDVEASARRNTVFASPPDDPRARRPVDAVQLAAALVVVLLLAWAHRSGTDLDRRVFDFVSDGLPGWISGTFTLVFIIGVALFGDGRHAVVRDMLLAGAITIVAAAVASQLAGPEWPDIIPELFERDGFPSYPVVRLSAVVAVLFVVQPYLSLPMRKVGRRMMSAMTIAALVMT
jgi:hypothetical protein